MHRTWTVAAAGVALAVASASHAASDDPPLPPPPPAPDAGGGSPDEPLRALSGEWRLQRVDGRPAPRRDTLTIWGGMFAAGEGCSVAQGRLRPLGGGRYRIEHVAYMRDGCRRLPLPKPFDAAELGIRGDRKGMAVRSPDGRTWDFAWSDPERTKASDAFLRGDWLLADGDGRPFRGAALTRLSFERGYSVRAANCTFYVDGWIADRSWIVRPGGSRYLQTRDCRPRSAGDRLAILGDKARFVAEPVEGRMRVVIDGRAATLVPAARHPELAAGAKTYPVDPWAGQLADAAARSPVDGRTDFLLRVLGGTHARAGAGGDARAIAFSGYSIAELDRLRMAGLPVDRIGGQPAERGYEDVLLGAPIVAIAEMEAIEPADRGDGLALDYRYRVVESWRGGGRAGDLLVVRMPPLLDKSRSPLITPEPGARVLLLASRPGYVVAALGDGRPPSIDGRVVAMTLPLLRVTDGKLAEAVPGANVLGSARFVGMPLAEARTRALKLDAKVDVAVADVRRRPIRYFVTHVGSRLVPDPTRLWIDYDPDLRVAGEPRIGGVSAWFDGCLERKGGLAPPLRSCPRGTAPMEPAVREAVDWIDDHGIPDTVDLDGSAEPFTPIQIPTLRPVTLRTAIR